ncbi:MAG TPA: PIN domain-containing protein [Dongiaceae bacterium]|nr:PIN domain-containing protein [Dongiaceae bacterium]
MGARIAIDASVIVRYLTGDEKTQSAAAADLFRAAQAGKVSLAIPTPTIQETVYVLERLYGLDAETIAPKLISLLAMPNVFAPDARWLAEALQHYRTKNSDFGDALLCAYAREEGWDVATFDKGLIKKFPEVSACTPAEWLSRTTQQKDKGPN